MSVLETSGLARHLDDSTETFAILPVSREIDLLNAIDDDARSLYAEYGLPTEFGRITSRHPRVDTRVDAVACKAGHPWIRGSKTKTASEGASSVSSEARDSGR
jgi:hypothetical protein